MILKTMCMMCMILSPNCCAVTIFEYSKFTLPTDGSCLSVPSEHRCFSKQMAECRFRAPKTSEEEEKCGASAIPR